MPLPINSKSEPSKRRTLGAWIASMFASYVAAILVAITLIGVQEIWKNEPVLREWVLAVYHNIFGGG